MKFIHTADLHIDSPLIGLEAYEGAPAARLRKATRDAFENLVSLAIDHEVDFVVVAGDLFDGPWRDMSTGLWTAGQFRRLERSGIRSFIIRGNHDAVSRVENSVSWPESVHEFSSRKAETIDIPELDVAIHGQSFPGRDVLKDLTEEYPEPLDGRFNIGLLHTSLAGSPMHDTYAPTTEAKLVSRGYDYWALGHVHGQQIVRERPYIVYSGNTQGRHANELGEKGCFLVEVHDEEVERVELLPTDVLRWHRVDIKLEEEDDTPELLASVRQRFVDVREADEERYAAVRLTVSGPCRAHRSLTDRSERESLRAEIHNIANELDDQMWVERIDLRTSAPIDLTKLRKGSDLMGELLRRIEELASDEEQLRDFADCLSPLETTAAGQLQQAGISWTDSELLRQLLQDAESMLVAQLAEAEQ